MATSSVDSTTPAGSSASSETATARSLIGADDHARQRARQSKRALLRGVRQGLLGLFLVASAGAALFALRPRPVPIDRTLVTRGPLVVAIEESGMTRVKNRYAISAPVTGTLSRVVLEPGDAVHEGDVLAEIAPLSSPLLDPRARAEAEARLGAALSAVGQTLAQAERTTSANELASSELTRLQQLSKTGAVAQRALEQAEFDVRMRGEELASAVFASKVAAEEVRMARAQLGRGSDRSVRDRHIDVVAPVSGRVLRVHQQSAGVIQAGTSLLEIGDPAVLEVVVDLLTTDAVLVRPGAEVSIAGFGADLVLEGRVSRIEPSAFTRPSALGVDEQRVNVIVAIIPSHEQWSGLGDGYHVEARFVLYRADSVLKVPHGAVFRHGDGFAVYRVEGGSAHLAKVTVGHRAETEVEITSGLPVGAAVAVHPGDRVKDGARVEPR